MALISPSWTLGLVAGIALIWAQTHPLLIVHSLHITRGSPLSMPTALFYAKPAIWIAMVFVVSLTVLATKWLSWSMSYIEADRNRLSFRVGPFLSNTIPTRSIQDVKYARGMFGLMLNYGTITLASGLSRVVIEYVPDVQTLAAMLQQAA